MALDEDEHYVTSGLGLGLGVTLTCVNGNHVIFVVSSFWSASVNCHTPQLPTLVCTLAPEVIVYRS